MFSIPLSAYFLTWALGINVPRGFLWGHLLEDYLGYWGMYIGITIIIIGGWRIIYREYWSKDEGEERLSLTESTPIYSIPSTLGSCW